MRRRYLAIKIVCPEKVSERDFFDAIWMAILHLFGEYGASKTNLALIEFNSKDGWAILRCSHETLENVKAAIASITKISQNPTCLHVMRVSGTIKSCIKRLSNRSHNAKHGG